MNEKVMKVIESLYDEGLPLVRFFQMPVNFQIPRTQLELMLFPANPATPEDSKRMQENSALFIDMMLASEILAVARPEKDAVETSDEPVKIIIAGKNFKKFVDEAKEYVDTDSIIRRTLDISRQDFDQIANEYRVIVAEVNNIDEILNSWSELDQDVKLGIIRGVLLQRSLMAETLIQMRARTLPVVRYQQETLAWIGNLLGPENQEPVQK